ncbi:MAG: TetR/AcrR family transcriptional regulator [Micromonosporaceae bacterium]
MAELIPLARPTQERADAARNRARILQAASRLFAEGGITGISMDAVAAEAGVGKGTLFRRFGSKAGLAVALLDERERDLQEAMLSGPSPLGPGARAADRLRAFAAGYLQFLERHLDLVRLSETSHPGARYQIGAYRFWHAHVSVLLAEINPGLDVPYVAHALLAPLAADLNQALTSDDFSFQRIRDGFDALLRVITEGGGK